MTIDGVEIYRGMAETCTDPSAVLGRIYFYAAFAADDRNNWSAPDAGAQWKSEDVPETSGLKDGQEPTPSAEKILRNGHVYIQRNTRTYTMLGQLAL